MDRIKFPIKEEISQYHQVPLDLNSKNQQNMNESDTIEYSELQYKKPKKVFKNREERDKYVQHYLSKEKTELCKNWETYGYCKFNEYCSFAHGIQELRSKYDKNSSYKLKQCKNFIDEGLCPYGTRCHFIHNPLSIDKQRDYSYSKMIRYNLKYVEERIAKLRRNIDSDDNIIYVNGYDRRRLPIFSKLSEGTNV